MNRKSITVNGLIWFTVACACFGAGINIAMNSKFFAGMLTGGGFGAFCAFLSVYMEGGFKESIGDFQKVDLQRKKAIRLPYYDHID